MMIGVGQLVSKTVQKNVRCAFTKIITIFKLTFIKKKKLYIPGLYGLPARSGKLKNLEHFDANFFGVHAKQAEVMDPQLRLLLESTYECIVDAGKLIMMINSR